MKVIDQGHQYVVDTYDAVGRTRRQIIKFFKREGPAFPGNTGRHPGTNCQELIRVLIDRVDYLNKQEPSEYNKNILACMRSSLVSFEFRAAERHKLGKFMEKFWQAKKNIEELPTCSICGHIINLSCKGHDETTK